jgi:hypothetical protein
MRCVVFVVLVLALACATACGGAAGAQGTTDPPKWAAAVCGAFADQMAQAQLAASVLPSAPAPSDVRQVLLDYIEQMPGLVQAMLRKIREAGAPAVDDGQALQRDLLSAVSRLDDYVERDLARARALPVDDPAAFEGALDEFSATLDAEIEEFSDAFEVLERFDSGALSDAFADNETCRSIGLSP